MNKDIKVKLIPLSKANRAVNKIVDISTGEQVPNKENTLIYVDKDNTPVNKDYLENNNYMRAFIEAKGVATCHEKDKFDKKIGRKIAYSKAFLEGYRKFHHIIDASIEALVNKHIDLSHTRDNLEAIINDEKSYLDKLRNCEK